MAKKKKKFSKKSLKQYAFLAMMPMLTVLTETFIMTRMLLLESLL